MAKLNPGIAMFRIFALFLLVNAFPHLALASDKKQLAPTSNEAFLILVGKPVSASLSTQKDSLPTDDNRVSFNVRMKVIEIIQGQYERKFIDVAVLSHSKERIMHNNFIITGKISDDGAYYFQSSYINRISCPLGNQDIPENLVYHVRYSRAPEGVQKDCLIF